MSPSGLSRGSIPPRVLSVLRAWVLLVLADMTLDILHLRSPSGGVPAEGFRAQASRELVEARLRDRQQGAVRRPLEQELDQRRRFSGVIDVWVDGVGLPSE